MQVDPCQAKCRRNQRRSRLVAVECLSIHGLHNDRCIAAYEDTTDGCCNCLSTLDLSHGKVYFNTLRVVGSARNAAENSPPLQWRGNGGAVNPVP